MNVHKLSEIGVENQEPEKLRDIREELNQLLADRGITQAQVAKSLNISSSQISQYMAGKYAGNSEKTEQILTSYIDREYKVQANRLDALEYYQTYNAKNIEKLCTMTHISKTMGVVIGRAGLGKTTALKHYAEKNAGTIYVEANMTYTSKNFLRSLGMQFYLGSQPTLFDFQMEIVERLKHTGRLMIIDQAEYLTEKSLDMIRTIHDNAGVGVVLAGLPLLESNIKGKAGVNEQIYTRIFSKFVCKKLEMDDAGALITNYFPDAEEFSQKILDASEGKIRVFAQLLMHAKRITTNHNIKLNESIINQIVKARIS